MRAETYLYNLSPPRLSNIPDTPKHGCDVALNSHSPWPVPAVGGCLKATVPIPHSEFHPRPAERISATDLGTGTGGSDSGTRARAVVLKVRFLDPQHQPQLGTCKKCKFPGPTLDVWSQRVRPSNLCFLKPLYDSQLEDDQLVNQPQP